MENLPLIFKRYTSENGGKELLGAVELRLELPGETDVRLGITAITFLVVCLFANEPKANERN